MTIKTEHRGHEISYKESDEMWACIDVGYRHNELSKVKARIDKMYRDEREANAVPCFEIDGVYRGQPELVPARIVEYGAQTDKSYGGKVAKEDHIVHVTAQRRGSQKPSRAQARISELVPDTPEAMAAWEAYLSACQEVKAAEDRARIARQAIPSISVEQIQPLIDIAGNREKKRAIG